MPFPIETKTPRYTVQLTREAHASAVELSESLSAQHKAHISIGAATAIAISALLDMRRDADAPAAGALGQ